MGKVFRRLGFAGLILLPVWGIKDNTTALSITVTVFLGLGVMIASVFQAARPDAEKKEAEPGAYVKKQGARAASLLLLFWWPAVTIAVAATHTTLRLPFVNKTKQAVVYLGEFLFPSVRRLGTIDYPPEIILQGQVVTSAFLLAALASSVVVFFYVLYLPVDEFAANVNHYRQRGRSMRSWHVFFILIVLLLMSASVYFGWGGFDPDIVDDPYFKSRNCVYEAYCYIWVGGFTLFYSAMAKAVVFMGGVGVIPYSIVYFKAAPFLKD
ncbi:hypothetical protein FF124_05075 [Martelella lutilitoris]|uniref:Uncharacterized protein n=1 Tax=Martelella lutilitoris TaxID=2583532 RepID=A0A5C4JVZ0_9HYPH|nr:hypothetical protein [Martelella lutilitoris]TNB49357.1 hypothetical protein FF124_05075 [Martelella lutilitoris]